MQAFIVRATLAGVRYIVRKRVASTDPLSSGLMEIVKITDFVCICQYHTYTRKQVKRIIEIIMIESVVNALFAFLNILSIYSLIWYRILNDETGHIDFEKLHHHTHTHILYLLKISQLVRTRRKKNLKTANATRPVKRIKKKKK